MSSPIRNPFTDIGGVSTTGSWSYSGSGSTGAAPLPPAAPALYDDDITFVGVDPGIYPYTYSDSVTVGSDTCDQSKTVTYVVTQSVPSINDNCSGAINVAFPYNTRIIGVQGNTAGKCPGLAVSTLDGSIAAPAIWGSFTFGGDIWYKISYDSSIPSITPTVMLITVDGEPYVNTNEAIYEPLIAVYSACGAGSFEAGAVSQSNTYKAELMITGVFTSSFTYYVRVCSVEGNEGKFDFEIVIG